MARTSLQSRPRLFYGCLPEGSHPRRVPFSISEIYEKIWNEDAIGGDNTVAVHIRHIREKIEINPKDPRYLKVVWGVGYKIDREQERI